MPERGKPLKALLKDRLADQLRADIAAGAFEPSGRLPSLAELQDEHGVSRNVVREALLILSDEGLIYVKGGKGSYVRNAKPELTLNRTGADPWSGLTFGAPPHNGRDYADQATAALFGIDIDDMVFTQDQAAAREDGSKVLIRRIVPALVIDDIKTDPVPSAYIPRAELLAALAEAYGPLGTIEDVTALPPSTDEAAALDLDPGHWALQAARLTVSSTGRTLMAEVERTAPHTHLRYPLD
jgi:DNA-binding GntR family transcriptional regulator